MILIFHDVYTVFRQHHLPFSKVAKISLFPPRCCKVAPCDAMVVNLRRCFPNESSLIVSGNDLSRAEVPGLTGGKRLGLERLDSKKSMLLKKNEGHWSHTIKSSTHKIHKIMGACNPFLVMRCVIPSHHNNRRENRELDASHRHLPDLPTFLIFRECRTHIETI